MNYNVIVPNIVVNFKCAMCGECCTGWNIEIDKATCSKLMKRMKKTYIEDKIEFEYSGNKIKGGKIKLLKNGKCPFLSTDKLCSLQKEKGIDYIGDVCKQYPRVLIATTRGIEQSMFFSCREALKLLDYEKTIEFDVNPKGYNYEAIKNSKFIASIDKSAILKYYYNVEETLIDILQQKNQSLKARLLLSGSLLLSLYDSEEEEHLDIINEYRSVIGKNINSFEELGVNKSILISLINKLGEAQIKLDSVSFLTKLFYANFNKNIDEVNEKYFVVNKFEYNYIIENLLVMHIFRKNFVYKADLIKNFYWMSLQYIYILLSMNINDDISKEQLLASIYISEKAFSHRNILKEDMFTNESPEEVMLNIMKALNYYDV